MQYSNAIINLLHIEVPETVEFSDMDIATYDAVIIVTDHDSIDYEIIADKTSLIIDTRNVMKFSNDTNQTIVKA